MFTFRYCENNLSSKVYIIYGSIYKYVIICKSQSQTVFLDWFNFFLKARRRSLRKTISSRLSRGESARHPDASRDIRSLSGSARLSLGDKEAEDSPDFPATRTTSDPCTTSSSASCTSTCETFHSLQLERKKYTNIYIDIKRILSNVLFLVASCRRREKWRREREKRKCRIVSTYSMTLLFSVEFIEEKSDWRWFERMKRNLSSNE